MALVLPTLLTSRTRHPTSSPKQATSARLPQDYTLPIRVRNTFIDTAIERSPSLEGFYREREVSTCPSCRAGLLRSLFQDMDSESPTGTPTPEAQSSAAPTVVLSLAEAIGEQISTCDSYYLEDVMAYGNACQVDGFGMDWCQPDYTVSCDQWWGSSFPDGWTCSELAPAELTLQGMTNELVPNELLPNELAELELLRSIPSELAPAELEMRGVPAPPEFPAPGCPELPSVGSVGHGEGRCEPCSFFHTKACASGATCQFCHLCTPDERKRRRRAKHELRRAAHRARKHA